MKRIISLVLVLCMLVCMVPAFTFASVAAEEENISGLNAVLYQMKCKDGVYNERPGDFEAIIQGKNGRGADCSYNDSKHFDSSIETLMKLTKEWPEYSAENVTNLNPIDKNGYILKWEGTITAAESGTYYLVGRKIDNGFVAFVDDNGNNEIEADEKFYEYWAENHWFDGGGDRLVTDLGGFTLEAGVATKVEFWYLEMDGGDVCAINASKNADGSDDKSFGDMGLSLSLKRTCYVSNIVSNHDRIYAVLPDGTKGGACVNGGHNKDNHDGNCSSCTDEGNHRFDATIAGIKAEMVELAAVTLPSFEKDGFQGLGKYGFIYEDSLIEYTGYMTPAVGGEYQFGTTSVDNCLVVEIEIDGTWTRVYEFWGARVWNDVSPTFYDKKVTLEENKSYPIRVTYLEIDGGEGLTTKVKIDGEEFGLLEKVALTTTKPTAPVKPSNINIFDGSQEWYYKTSGPKNEFQIRDDAWMTDPAVYGTWEKVADPGVHWGTADNPENNQSFWAVTTFEIEDLEAIEGYELMMRLKFDDNIRLYVNGQFVNREFGWQDNLTTWSLAEEATDLLVEGTNTIAMKLVQGWGGSMVYVDSCWLTLDENGNAPYEFKYIDKDGVKQSGVITTADQWLAYVADANARGDANRDDRIMIAADLDFTDKTWVPLNKYIGQIYGEYHSFKNITYTVAADATGGMQTVGLVVNNLANFNANGHIENLIIDNATFTVEATNGNGFGNAVFAGLVAGQVDRGRLENVTVKNSKLLGNAYAAGGIAGDACWNYDENGVHVENCAVIDTEVNAANYVAGILAVAKNGDRVRIGNAYVKNVTLNAPESSLDYAAKWDNDNVVLYSTTVEGVNTIGKTLAAPEGDANYKFYYQTKPGADGTTDYRIICVANKAWATAQPSIKVSISFFDDSLEKSTVVTANTVYEKVTATSGNLTEVYGVDAESVVFGWVVKGVPAEFVVEEPAVDVVS